jgi:hypothetical protein
MIFVYEGHDAAGKEQAGTVNAKSLEEAAELVRRDRKVYARKIEPAKVQPQEVDHRAEAARLVRQQAEIQDNLNSGKMHVYTPDLGLDGQADPSKYAMKHVEEKLPKKAERAEPKFVNEEEELDAPKQYAWEAELERGLEAAEKVAARLSASGKVSVDLVDRLKNEMVKTAVIAAWSSASRI